ncbi:MAG: ABC transporter permease subunit [Acidilobaceae archaeon]
MYTSAKLALKLVLAVVLFLSIVMPLTTLFLWSFAIKWYWPSPVPQELGVDYWLEALGIRRGHAIGAVSVVSALRYSIIIALITVVVTQLISIPASYALARYSVPYKPLLLFLFLMPQIFPLQPIYVNLMRLFYAYDLVGTIPGVVLAHTIPAMVFAIWINTATFKAIQPELEEAARVSGAGPLVTLVRITLPLAVPGLLASTVFVFLYSFDEFTGTFFIGLPYIQTLPMLLYSASGYNMQFASAAAVILLVISAAFMLLLERFLKAEYLGRIG